MMLRPRLFYVLHIIVVAAVHLRAILEWITAIKRTQIVKSTFSAVTCTKSGDESKCAAPNGFLLESEWRTTHRQTLYVSLWVVTTTTTTSWRASMHIPIDDRAMYIAQR